FRASLWSGGGRRVGIPACWFAAALLAKASGLVFGPLCLAVVEIERLVREKAKRTAESGGQRTPARRRLFPFSFFLFPSPFWRDCIQIGVLGIVLVFVYCGSDWQPQMSFVNWAKRLPDGPQARAIVWLSE